MTTTKNLPTHVNDLYPPIPACTVTANDEAQHRADLARLPLEARRDQLTARQNAITLELPDMFTAGKTVDALLEELVDIDGELGRLDVKIAAVSQAGAHLIPRRMTLERTDTIYRAWDERRREINRRWADAMSGLPSLSDGASYEQIARARTAALFGVMASVQSDADDWNRDTRDSGRFLSRGRR